MRLHGSITLSNIRVWITPKKLPAKVTGKYFFYLSNEIFTTQNSCSQKSNIFSFKTSWLLDLLLNQGVILPMRNCRMQSVLSNLSDFFLKICLRNVNIPPDFFLNCLKLSIFLLKFCLNCFQNLSAECRYFSECFEDQCCFINMN